MRSRGSSPLVFGVLGLLATAFTAVVVVAGLTGGDDVEAPAAPGSGPVATEGPGPEPIEGAEVAPPSFRPPQRLNLGSAAGSRVALAAARRQVVDLRTMRRADTAARLKRNPLYGTGVMLPTACRAPRPSTRSQDMLAYLDAVSSCLDRAWAGKFSQAGAVFQAPRRVYWSRPGRGPCGTYPAPNAAAYYCPANRGMYIGLGHVIEQTGGRNPAGNHVPYLTVLAHEYGHHVQSMAGIGGAWWWEVSDRSKAAQNAYSRRSELQAQCLAGVFARSVRTPLAITGSRWQEVLESEYGRGDDQNGVGLRDHGSGEHFAAWIHQGWRYAKVGYCNTWVVPSSQVS
ncbi:neutral zinc metallopeptidase [Streptosporangium sandarakinum]|uniref:Metalloprotease n=1 Tax=Streptosporangium sandarakinum TaxID=1260955 RepID=A0A852UVL6_9ACTN|nr:neutral zinc metallopeptidase [Streptosporangium sandarakinum]NYF40269.1 hypothetical protein [Streptosporangium sandarakinum]